MGYEHNEELREKEEDLEELDVIVEETLEENGSKSFPEDSSFDINDVRRIKGEIRDYESEWREYNDIGGYALGVASKPQMGKQYIEDQTWAIEERIDQKIENINDDLATWDSEILGPGIMFIGAGIIYSAASYFMSE